MISANILFLYMCGIYLIILLSISDPPAVFVTPDGTVTVQESSVVNITCVFDANPPDVTEIVWYKDGNRLLRDTTQRLETRHPLSAVLALFNLSRHDSGAYTCHVRNAFGKGNSTTTSVLNVLCKFRIINITKNVIKYNSHNRTTNIIYSFEC